MGSNAAAIRSPREYVTVGDQIGITGLPAGVDVATAGVLGLAGTAALDVLAAAAPQAGETVLISGATGRVGAITIQYTAAAGARVIATARPGAESDFVRGLGAADVVDHTGDLAAQVRAIGPDGVDVVLHLAGDGEALTGPHREGPAGRPARSGSAPSSTRRRSP